MYDIIGDVHGYAAQLKKLLVEMGYQKTNGSYSHPTRKAIFVGDFINRGPEIRKTIRTIKAMVDNGNAYAVLGNHELNAIIYHLKDKQGKSIISKPSKYFLSLFKTINEYSSGSKELNEQLRWMRTLPLYLDLGEIRVVHACWCEDAIKVADSLYEDGRIRKSVFRKVYKKSSSDEAKSVWRLTKGVYLKLPPDIRVMNNKGVSPRSFRIRWWDNLEGKTFKEGDVIDYKEFAERDTRKKIGLGRELPDGGTMGPLNGVEVISIVAGQKKEGDKTSEEIDDVKSEVNNITNNPNSKVEVINAKHNNITRSKELVNKINELF